MTRMMSGSDRAITTMTYSAVASLCILSAMVPFVWVAPTWHDIMFGILIGGVASTAGAVDRGAGVPLCRRLGAGAVLLHMQLLWVSILGFLVFGEVPDIWTITGAAFIVASGLYTAHRESVSDARSCWRCRANRRNA